MAQTPRCAHCFRLLPIMQTAVLLLSALAFRASVSAAEPPKIDRIELFQTSQVTLHFDTEANRTYELQFRNQSGTNNVPWTNLFVAPRIPFPNHYIVVDTRTNAARIYRLKVTP